MLGWLTGGCSAAATSASSPKAASAEASRLSESRLFTLLSNKPEEGGLIGVLCTLNKIVWALVLIKWINFEIWWWVGGGAFAMNRCC